MCKPGAVTLPSLADLPGRACSIAGALEVVGDRWALLVIREVSLGSHRFTDIARGTGAPRDRLTARLPMLRQPHPEGLVGAIRVEIRGLRAGSSDTLVYGAMDRPAVAAGAVAAVVAVAAARGTLEPGAGGLASRVNDPVPLLTELAGRGVRCAVFEGAGI